MRVMKEWCTRDAGGLFVDSFVYARDCGQDDWGVGVSGEGRRYNRDNIETYDM